MLTFGFSIQHISDTQLAKMQFGSVSEEVSPEQERSGRILSEDCPRIKPLVAQDKAPQALRV